MIPHTSVNQSRLRERASDVRDLDPALHVWVQFNPHDVRPALLRAWIRHGGWWAVVVLLDDGRIAEVVIGASSVRPVLSDSTGCHAT